MGNIFPENSEEEIAFLTFFNYFCSKLFFSTYIHSILHFAEKMFTPRLKEGFISIKLETVNLFYCS